MNIFDTLKVRAFDVITNVMGYDASWTSSVSGITLSARVGYKDPSEKQELSGIDSWNPDEPFMEYRAGMFEGLKYLVDQAIFQRVTIAGKGIFEIREIQTKFDGDTFVARLVLVP
jgi:hypothetical protein